MLYQLLAAQLPTTTAELLAALQSGLGYVLMGALLSFLAERLAFVQALSPTDRGRFVMVGAVVIGAVALAVQTYVPAEVFVTIDPFVKGALGIIALYTSSQIYHAVVNRGTAKSPEKVAMVENK